MKDRGGGRPPQSQRKIFDNKKPVSLSYKIFWLERRELKLLLYFSTACKTTGKFGLRDRGKHKIVTIKAFRTFAATKKNLKFSGANTGEGRQ